MEHAKAIHPGTGLVSEAGNLKCNKNDEIKGQLVHQEMLAKNLFPLTKLNAILNNNIMAGVGCFLQEAFSFNYFYIHMHTCKYLCLSCTWTKETLK